MNVKVKGGQKLTGKIKPSGSKNSAVAIIPATILFDKEVVLENIPDITDVQKLLKVLERLGSKIDWNGKKNLLKIDNSKLSTQELKPNDLGDIRGTSLLWGPMLARFKKLKFVGIPGGCKLGFRTLQPHFEAFSDLGVEIKQETSTISMNAEKASSNEIWLKEMSPTTTENAIMFSVSLKGNTKIIGAASEPQVQDLCIFLRSAGVNITGIGSSILEIKGGNGYKPVTHKVFSDHNEIATFIALCAATKGSLIVQDSEPLIFRQLAWFFSKFGINIEYDGETAHIKAPEKIIIDEEGKRGFLTVRAQPWPGLPVDILPLFIPLALAADEGQVLFHNWMYDSGLFWTNELKKVGANLVMCDPHRILVTAGRKLQGATMEAPYIIRASVALVMSAMIAKGESIIKNADALYRGHPDFSKKLTSLGASIEEIK